MVANNAGMPATPADLINVDEVIGKYYDVVPDPNVPEQRVSFGTSGHRGSSLKTSFNEAHIVAITQAIAEYRKKAGVTGPLYIGRDTHALSEPAWKTAIEVLVANGVTVRIDSRDDFTPTPVVSQAILTHNRAADGTQRFTGEGLADGIVVTPSHNPPTDGGFGMTRSPAARLRPTSPTPSRIVPTSCSAISRTSSAFRSSRPSSPTWSSASTSASTMSPIWRTSSTSM